MTVETLHDALSLLPDDLVAETDKKRLAKPKIIPWKQYFAMAACFTLVLACGLFSINLLRASGGAKESAAPEAALQIAGADAAAPAAIETQAAAAEEIGIITDSAAGKTMEAAAEDAPAEEAAVEESASDRTQNAATSTAGATLCSVTRLSSGEVCFLPEANTAVLQTFLTHLQFDPYLVCNCLAEYRVDFSAEVSFEINLTEGFIRSAQGQVLLTDIQIEELLAILPLPEVTP